MRENEKLGYSALEEEMPENEENPFEDIGGSEQSPFSEDKWEENKHPRKENGQFGEGKNTSNKKSSVRQNNVKSRERRPLKMSDYEKAVLRDTVSRNQFNDEETENGYAFRNTSQYKYFVKIDNADLLSYTPIKRWKNK